VPVVEPVVVVPVVVVVVVPPVVVVVVPLPDVVFVAAGFVTVGTGIVPLVMVRAVNACALPASANATDDAIRVYVALRMEISCRSSRSRLRQATVCDVRAGHSSIGP